MAVLILIIIIDVLLVVAVMYWGSKENLEEGHGSADESKAVAYLRAKQPNIATPEAEKATDSE